MKRLFSFSALMVACTFSFATVRTLCNMPYSPGQYTTFADAYNASVNGDTIYVHGSSISYGTFFISKALVIIGAGFNPSKQMPLPSTFQDLIILQTDVQLIGLTCNLVGIAASSGVIKKCYIKNASGNYCIDFSSSAGDWLVEGCVLETTGFAINFQGGSADNTIIQNNIFSQVSGAMIYLANNSAQRTYFLNNVILGNAGYDAFYTINYTTFNNNIFIGNSPDRPTAIVTDCSANNNISYLCSDNTFYSPGINNLVNVDPMFTSYTYGNPFSFSNDFQLATGSPGLANGSDGTDRGVYGGLGFKFSMTGEPPIAEITAFTITSPTTIAPGGSLTISITSKRVH